MKTDVRLCAQDARKFGMIWFGAAISLAEIEAGLYSGGHPLAVVFGHLLGGALLYFAGLMGARRQENGMECTREAFGVWGMRFFATANILQLIGWTAVMISQGALAAKALLPRIPTWAPALLLGMLVVLWIFVGLRSFSWIAIGTMVLLLALVAYLSVRILMTPYASAGEDVTSSFWEVFELSLAMPLSWLPLIADYTKGAKAPRSACGASALVYTGGSLWMYFLGVGLSSLQAESIAQGILLANIGLWGLLVIIISTVTTTYLDAYSAGESAKTLMHDIPPKAIAVVVCGVGVVFAIVGIMDRYTNFLYLISSLFVPMAIAMLADHFLFRHRRAAYNFVAFLVGFAVYHLGLAGYVPWLSPSLAAIAATFATEAILAVIKYVHKIHKRDF